VIAIEPQPACIRFLTRFYGGDSGVVIVPSAVGATTGQSVMYLSKSTPTVSSLSPDWIRSMKVTPGFKKVRWDVEIKVNITTLDALIIEFGLPVYTKIDVEGFELEVLRGLHQPLSMISFEYLPAASQRAQACINRINELGTYQFNWTIRERTRFVSSSWIDGGQMEKIIAGMPEYHPSGDIYCRLIDPS
jgi:FkbM family methyltransferase